VREDSLSQGLQVEEFPECKVTDGDSSSPCYLCRVLNDVVQNGLGQACAVRAAVKERSKNGDRFGGNTAQGQHEFDHKM